MTGQSDVMGRSDDPIHLLLTVTKRRYDVPLTALGHLAAQDLERLSGLIEEIRRGLDDEPPGVPLPGVRNARINFGGSGW